MPKSAIRLLGLLMGISAAAPAVAAPAMWEVRDADSVIWLFGSFHVLPENLEWRTPLFDQTLADADKIVFEADVRPGAMAELAAEAFARGIYTDGKLLSDFIAPAAEAKAPAKKAAPKKAAAEAGDKPATEKKAAAKKAAPKADKE